jgi:hypothetical protein
VRAASFNAQPQAPAVAFGSALNGVKRASARENKETENGERMKACAAKAVR